jgi:hypothetical protein
MRAKDAIEQALHLSPDLPLAHHVYAQLESDLGRAQDALVRLLARVSRAAMIQNCLLASRRFAGTAGCSKPRLPHMSRRGDWIHRFALAWPTHALCWVNIAPWPPTVQGAIILACFHWP